MKAVTKVYSDKKEMEIFLKLKNHCIETEAKLKYERLIHTYFSNACPENDFPKIERQIEALKFFLEHADFAQLRTVYPELCGIKDIPFSLKIPRDYRKIRININSRMICPEWKKR